MEKATVIQYEYIRQQGWINMFDYYGVVDIAEELGLKTLAGMSLEDYQKLQMKYGTYCKKYGIEQAYKININEAIKGEML